MPPARSRCAAWTSKSGTASLFNPLVYVISGFRWTFYGRGDVSVAVSVIALLAFVLAGAWLVWWMFRTGYRLKN